MTQLTTSSPEGIMLRAFVKDQTRMDNLIPRLKAVRGGSWSRAHVIEIALDALEKRLTDKTFIDRAN